MVPFAPAQRLTDLTQHPKGGSMRPVRITVLEKAFHPHLASAHLTEEAAKTFGECGHEVGERFLVTETPSP